MLVHSDLPDHHDEAPQDPPPSYEDASTAHSGSTSRAASIATSDITTTTSSYADPLTPGSSTQGSLLGELITRLTASQAPPSPPPPPPPQYNTPPPIGDHKLQTDLPSAPNQPTLHEIQRENPRRTLSTRSQPLLGTFPLFESLSLRTHSGLLTATVPTHSSPSISDQKRPPLQPPAQLIAHSHCGALTLDMLPPPQTHATAPPRDHNIVVSTHASKIRASLLLGRNTVVKSHCGTLNLLLKPIPLPGAGTANLMTQTHSSRQDIQVYSNTGGTFSLNSVHHTHAGSLVLRYPADWEGSIEGDVAGGKVEIRGCEGEVDVFERTPRRVRAVKGRGGVRGGGGNTLKFHSRSGKVEIYFGEV
ncbi:hypothetical protein B0A50_06600 [Salinomyces thailandicus]|uniref:Uncharacterized protein n=1 Tax=Salinomyces thailandicus TaxID=706561 RepID=A0A4U0TRR3_9PEZI|nr:hypothetical protein B0A50_06600 [Salinomyces thailandica]